MTAATPERYGFLTPLLADATVEEIIVLGGSRTFVVRDGRKELLSDVADVATVRRIADQLLHGSGRRVDLASPIVSARLEDGSRVHITGPPVTRPEHLNIQIRKFVLRSQRLSDLVESGSLTAAAASFLTSAVESDQTILVAGAPGAGKTTLVNCLLNEVHPDQRVVTCEEVFEISAELPDMTQMQTREAGLDGGGAITLRDLVREALRQRPDRLVVGEVRGPEALDLLMALNAGCSGLATIHANSAADSLEKLVSYGMLAGENIGSAFLRRTISRVVDVIVFLRRDADGRAVDHIACLANQLSDDVCSSVPVFETRSGGLVATGLRPPDRRAS